MLLKVHQSYRKVVALCDTNLLGKKLEEGIRQLDIKDHFFNGEEVDVEKATELLVKHARDDSTFNIVGKEAVEAAIDAEILSPESVDEIQGVPFALILL